MFQRFPTARIEAAVRDAEHAANDMKSAMHQMVYGHLPEEVEYDFETCLREFRAAVAYVDAAWEEYHATR